MEVDAAHWEISQHLTYEPGRFYGYRAGLHLGAGLFYEGIRYPRYEVDRQRFVTLRGVVYVLTHECDVDPQNVRPFNDHLVICPVLDFREFIPRYLAQHTEQELRSILACLGQRQMSRVMYVPPIVPCLPYGGLLYFNFIASTSVSTFGLEGANSIAALSVYGLEKVDQMLLQHFHRPKADWLQGANPRWHIV